MKSSLSPKTPFSRSSIRQTPTGSSSALTTTMDSFPQTTLIWMGAPSHPPRCRPLRHRSQPDRSPSLRSPRVPFRRRTLPLPQRRPAQPLPSPGSWQVAPLPSLPPLLPPTRLEARRNLMTTATRLTRNLPCVLLHFRADLGRSPNPVTTDTSPKLRTPRRKRICARQVVSICTTSTRWFR